MTARHFLPKGKPEASVIPMTQITAYRLTFLVCLAEILGMASIANFSALLPTFQGEWQLSHTAAGWISAACYAGYMVLVPLLASITDSR